MSLKFNLSSLRRRALMLFAVVALSAALFPTAAFASSYGPQGRYGNHGPRQQQNYHRPAQNQNWKSNCTDTYRVKRGDTLSKIAQRYGVTVNQLVKLNGIKNANRIYAGQVICIPC